MRAPLIWPALFGLGGLVVAWFILGHPHAWQLLPLYGLAFGFAIAAVHWLVLAFGRYLGPHHERDV